MRLPNGFGNVSKLPGNRRKPYRARITTGWTYTEDGNKHQQYKTLGYYETREEALVALSNYKQNPYDIDSVKATFSEIYEKWSKEHFPKVSKTNIYGYTAAYNLCGSLYNMPFKDIKRSHLQYVIDYCGKNYPTLRKLKVLLSQMYKFAMQNDVCGKDYSAFIDIAQYKDRNPDSIGRAPFTSDEIATVWRWKDSNDYFSIILMLIYTGVRIGELLDLKKINVNLEERWFYVEVSKTDSGIRRVPIADKVFPFFHWWYNKNDCAYLLSSPDGKHFTYRNYYDSYWAPLVEQAGLSHRPHDTRHTCISLLTAAGVDDKIIKKIVGHKGLSVTEVVYTHFEMQQLLDAINKI